MIIKKTEEFEKWFRKLGDRFARTRLALALLEAEELGGFANVKYVGGGVYEARFYFGPGYRLYYSPRGGSVLLLLIGGDKTSQRRDIRKACAINNADLRRRHDRIQGGR